MTDADRPAFAAFMVTIGETFGEPVSDGRLEIYFRALSDLELPAILRAADAHVRTSKFFPRPAELREGVLGSLEDAGEQAWIALRREVRRVGYTGVPIFPDAATRLAALALFGGWRALCERLPGEGPELLGYAKQFKALHRAEVARQRHDALPAATWRELSQ